MVISDEWPRELCYSSSRKKGKTPKGWIKKKFKGKVAEYIHKNGLSYKTWLHTKGGALGVAPQD